MEKKNIVERSRPQMTIWRMHIACWIPRATDAHSSCVIIHCFPTTTVVAQIHLSVMLYIHLPLLLYLIFGLIPVSMKYHCLVWSCMNSICYVRSKEGDCR